MMDSQGSLDFTAATPREQGDIGAARALDRAERADPSFSSRARAFVLDYLKKHTVSSGELITDAAKLAGIKPPDDRAFGGIYKALSNAGKIMQDGWCERRKGHSTGGGRVWRYVSH